MLVTAGFVFNEVFLYWFPNFTFAYLLIAFLLGMNLLGQDFAEKVQVVSIIAVLTGLFALSLIGITTETAIPAEPTKSGSEAFFPAGMYAMLLFIGFDIAFMRGVRARDLLGHSATPVISGIVLALFMFCLWGIASVMHVSSGRLADTTIPYSIAAREILGQNGRLIMGVVIIAGTLGAVNALLLGTSWMISGMAMEGLLPNVFTGTERRTAVPLILISGGIALLMASGITGQPEIVLYVRAGLLLWLLNYVIVFFCLLLLNSRLHVGPQPPRNPSLLIVNMIGFSVSSMALISLVSADTNRAALLTYILVTLGAWLILTSIWHYVANRRGRIFSL